MIPAARSQSSRQSIRRVALIALALATGSGLLRSFATLVGAEQHAPGTPAFTILVYHRFGAAASNEMTIRTSTFRSQLEYLKAHHYPVVPLRDVIAYLRGKGPQPPASAVVITADDGHRSVRTDMLPLVKQFGVPVTLFIYPSAISNASYAMTWADLDGLRATRLFDVESHTYWHPNFKIERRRLAPEPFRELSTKQLCRARTVLGEKTGSAPDLVAWPFGIYDEEVAGIAQQCGYVAAFTLGARPVVSGGNLMALPRYLVTDDAVGKRFAAMLPPEPK